MTRFSVVAADPAWRHDDQLTMRKGHVRRGATANYRTMATEAICALGEELRPSLADDGLLFLWLSGPMLSDALRVCDAWGFRQTQIGDWIKLRRRPKAGYRPAPHDPVLPNGASIPLAFNMGRVMRGCKESFFVCVRGRYSRLLGRRNMRDVIFDVAGTRHSEKTDCLQACVDQLVPRGARLELFARRAYPGWVCLGDESPHSLGADLVESLRRLHAGPVAWPESWREAVGRWEEPLSPSRRAPR